MIMERELLLLGILRQMRMYGYQLHEFIERDLSSCTDLKKATTYFLLDKMAKKGWISQIEEREGNRPPRQVYEITPEGEQVFQRLLRENLRTHTSARFAGDIGIAYADSLPAHELQELLALRRKALVEELEIARAVPEHQGSIQLLLEHRVVHLQAELAWLDTIINRFNEQES
jgi:DNA-binding PadR family transcriptional regulator